MPPLRDISIFYQWQEDTIILVVETAAVSADGAGGRWSQEEEEDICVLEAVKMEPFFLSLGPPPPSLTVPLNPSGFQEKDQNLKYTFHSMDLIIPL